MTYEIHAIASSFYPGEEVKIVTPESNVRDRVLRALSPTASIDINENESSVRFAPGTAPYAGGPGWKDKSPKDDIKRFIYTAFSKETGTTLPWGVLTGVRPVKPALSMLEEGRTREEIEDKYISEYYVNRDKAALIYDIAVREHEILGKLMSPYSLYIGIPFCPTTCMYCSFASYPIGAYREMVDGYIDRVIEELEDIPGIFGDNRPDTVYIGGGTPTSLSAAQLDRLMSEVDRIFDTGSLLEYTVEAGRPDTVTEDRLTVLKEHGVSRISINPQSMNEKTLGFIGRSHSPTDVERAFQLARELGFDNINADIILGLPGEGRAEVLNTMEKMASLSPESLTVHALAVKNAARMRKWIAEHGADSTVIEEGVPELVMEKAAGMGLSPYYLYRQKHMTGNLENTGYAREGRYGIYNVLMMEERQSIAAAGAGTVSKRVGPGRDIKRSVNVKELKEYMDRYQEMISRRREVFAPLRN